jgi:hypothetical protein
MRKKRQIGTVIRVAANDWECRVSAELVVVSAEVTSHSFQRQE